MPKRNFDHVADARQENRHTRWRPWDPELSQSEHDGQRKHNYEKPGDSRRDQRLQQGVSRHVGTSHVVAMIVDHQEHDQVLESSTSKSHLDKQQGNSGKMDDLEPMLLPQVPCLHRPQSLWINRPPIQQIKTPKLYHLIAHNLVSTDSMAYVLNLLKPYSEFILDMLIVTKGHRQLQVTFTNYEMARSAMDQYERRNSLFLEWDPAHHPTGDPYDRRRPFS
ncbi:hypothetical protein BC940DRAFT_334750 [Gongronella butleri]|nr:hypothetical protein BC940DRAFT_334750 [Gongronella butleri]